MREWIRVRVSVKIRRHHQVHFLHMSAAAALQLQLPPSLLCKSCRALQQRRSLLPRQPVATTLWALWFLSYAILHSTLLYKHTHTRTHTHTQVVVCCSCWQLRRWVAEGRRNDQCKRNRIISLIPTQKFSKWVVVGLAELRKQREQLLTSLGTGRRKIVQTHSAEVDLDKTQARQFLLSGGIDHGSGRRRRRRVDSTTVKGIEDGFA